MKEAVLFDLDNTLYEYEPAHQKALQSAHKTLKKEIKISFSEFKILFDLSKSEVQRELSGTASSHNRVLYFQRLIEKTHKTIDSKIVLNLYDSYWKVFLNNMRPRKGAVEVLKELKKRGIKTAIVSDLTTHIQLRKMEVLKITPYIDVLVTSEEAGSEKPHPIMFLLALNKLKMTPQDTLMVGDNCLTDIEGANSVGIDSVLLDGASKDNGSDKDYRIPKHSIKELKEIIGLL